MTLKLALESDENSRWLAILIGSEKDAEYWLEMQSNQAADEDVPTAAEIRQVK
jgi:hypothetical protein